MWKYAKKNAISVTWPFSPSKNWARNSGSPTGQKCMNFTTDLFTSLRPEPGECDDWRMSFINPGKLNRHWTLAFEAIIHTQWAIENMFWNVCWSVCNIMFCRPLNHFQQSQIVWDTSDLVIMNWFIWLFLNLHEHVNMFWFQVCAFFLHY